MLEGPLPRSVELLCCLDKTWRSKLRVTVPLDNVEYSIILSVRAKWKASVEVAFTVESGAKEKEIQTRNNTSGIRGEDGKEVLLLLLEDSSDQYFTHFTQAKVICSTCATR
jgi:hypothetical protein